MTKFSHIFPIVLACSCMTSQVLAGDVESKPIFKKGHWTVLLNHDTSDGDLWCSAETQNAKNQAFALVTFDNGNSGLLIGDSRWDLRERPVRFFVDIDSGRWTMDGSAGNSFVSLSFNDTESASEFTSDLMRGDVVAVYNDSDTRLGTFSLNGSFAAISELVDCWGRITANHDPFTNRTDPFGASSDPF